MEGAQLGCANGKQGNGWLRARQDGVDVPGKKGMNGSEHGVREAVADPKQGTRAMGTHRGGRTGSGTLMPAKVELADMRLLSPSGARREGRRWGKCGGSKGVLGANHFIGSTGDGEPAEGRGRWDGMPTGQHGSSATE